VYVVARGHWEAFYCRRTEGVEFKNTVSYIYIIYVPTYYKVILKKISYYIVLFICIMYILHIYNIHGIHPPSTLTFLFFFNNAVIQNMIFCIFKSTLRPYIFKMFKIFYTTRGVYRVDFCFSNENPLLIQQNVNCCSAKVLMYQNQSSRIE